MCLYIAGEASHKFAKLEDLQEISERRTREVENRVNNVEIRMDDFQGI